MSKVPLEEHRPSRQPVKTHIDENGCVWAVKIQHEGYLVMRVRRHGASLKEGVAVLTDQEVQRFADEDDHAGH